MLSFQSLSGSLCQIRFSKVIFKFSLARDWLSLVIRTMSLNNDVFYGLIKSKAALDNVIWSEFVLISTKVVLKKEKLNCQGENIRQYSSRQNYSEFFCIKKSENEAVLNQCLGFYKGFNLSLNIEDWIFVNKSLSMLLFSKSCM